MAISNTLCSTDRRSSRRVTSSASCVQYSMTSHFCCGVPSAHTSFICLIDMPVLPSPAEDPRKASHTLLSL